MDRPMMNKRFVVLAVEVCYLFLGITLLAT